MQGKLSPIQWLKVLYWVTTFPIGPKERRRKLTRLLTRSRYFDHHYYLTGRPAIESPAERSTPAFSVEFLLCLKDFGIVGAGALPFPREELESIHVTMHGKTLNMASWLRWFHHPAHAQRQRLTGFSAFIPLPEIRGDETTVAFTIKRRGCETRFETECVDRFDPRETILKRLHHYERMGAFSAETFALVAKQVIANRGISPPPNISALNFGTHEDFRDRELDLAVLIPVDATDNSLKLRLSEIHASQGVGHFFIVKSLDDLPFLRDVAEQSHALNQVPFRLLFVDHVQSDCGALNAAIDAIPARECIILGKSVYGTRNDWPEKIKQSYRAHFARKPGLLTATLEREYNWQEIKGAQFHFSQPVPNISSNQLLHPVAAALGGCLYFSRDFWRKVGGMDHRYSTLEFCVADFCLRALEAGFATKVDPSLKFLDFARDENSPALRRVDQIIFSEHWENFLRHRLAQELANAGRSDA